MVALACGVLRSGVNKVLVMTAVKGADRGFSIRAGLFTREAMFGDLAELSVGVLVAYVATASAFMALLALPCVTLLQRSQRHYQLVSDSRIDGRTGVLNAVTWQREAAVRVTRATRPRAWKARWGRPAAAPGHAGPRQRDDGAADGRPGPLRRGQQHLRAPGRQRRAGRRRGDDARAPAGDRPVRPVRRGRVRDPAAGHRRG